VPSFFEGSKSVIRKKSRKNSRSIQTDRPGAGVFVTLCAPQKRIQKIKISDLVGVGSRALNVVELLLGLTFSITLMM
jgi:hypothetical protein